MRSGDYSVMAMDFIFTHTFQNLPLHNVTQCINLQYQESCDYYNRPAGYRQGSVTAFIDKNTGEVYKPASWKAPAKHVRYDLRIIREREFLLNPKNCDWAGGHLYMR